MDEIYVKLLGVWVAVILFFSMLYIAHDYCDKSDEEREQAYQMIEDGSKVYLDGREVKPEYIVLEEYSITIRDNIVILND